MNRQTKESAVTRLLDELEFSISELAMLRERDWPPERVLAACEQMIADGYTSERYVREAFEESRPELFTLAPPPGFTARAAADFGEEETRFLWRPYLPIGDYTVLMAPGGAGKTYFTCAVAATVSRGEALPGDEAPDGPGTVLLISAEDRGELLRKRLSASGADLSRVFLLDCTDSEGLSITEGWSRFCATVKAYSPRLVVLDPWHGFLGADVDINRVNAVRPVFQRLANLAKDCGCALVLISHVNKRAQGENVNFAATGSTDFVNAARSALYLLNDPEDEDARVAVHTKSNYARGGDSVRFRITPQGGAAWDGFSEIDRAALEEAARRRKSVGELCRAREEESRMNEALLSALSDAANPFGVERFSYAEFKARYGENVFGTQQPKRALEAVADELYARGYEVKAGVYVRRSGTVQKGFSIAGIGDEL